MLQLRFRSRHRPPDLHPRERLSRWEVVSGYQVDGMIGQGASSTVHRARRVEGPPDQVVALKRLRPPVGPEAVERLRHEGEVLGRLRHPNVVRLLEVVPDRGGVALVMEHAAGGSLAGLLAGRGRLAPREVVAVAAPLADALAHAHGQGVVHGDVKPANVLLRADGEPLLSDFNVGPPGCGAEPDGAPSGTAGYVDPAVLEGSAVDERSDVYGLGALCHAMLLGRLPSPGPAGAADRLAPAALTAVVEKALAPRPAERFAGAGAMAAALRSALDVPPALPGPAAPTGPHPAGPPTRAFGPSPPGPGSPTSPPRSEGRRHHRVLVAVTAATVAVVGAAGVAVVLARGGAHRPSVGRCPPVTSPMSADLDGDGCPSAVNRTGNVLEVEGRRYELGRAGDAVVLGDWDCDGRDTPALYRPGGELFFFDSWAEEGRSVPASSRGVQLPNGRPEVRRGDDGCDHLVVR